MSSPPTDDSPETGQVLEVSTPAPWAAAVAVMAMLAFGVLVGAAASPVAPSGAATPVLLAVTPAVKTAPPAATPPAVLKAPTPPPTPATTPVVSSATEAAPSTTTTKTSTPSAGNGSGGGRGGKGEGGGRGGKEKSASTPSGAAALPPIKHVFLIVLSDQGAEAAFGPSSPAPYLAKTLTGEGELLENYYATSEGELANAIALISGQGPTPQTASDCPQYTDVTPGTVGAEGQTLGSGCIYPPHTLTLADQLTSAGKTWKAYVEGVDPGEVGQPASCRHPTLGGTDPDNAPSTADAYATWRNPFVYFHSLIDGAECAQDDVGLGRLTADLETPRTTPSLAYVVPDRCDDGSAVTCASGQPAGLQAAEPFLRKVVPEIKASAAYREGGLIAVTFDQAPRTGQGADSSGCCITTTYPNLPTPGSSATTAPSTTAAAPPAPPASGASATTTPAGGGRVGLLLISKYVKPGTLNVAGEYNHFALLRSIENLFALNPLGYAAAPGLLTFDSSVFNAYK
jgi:hypothetical protein